MRAIVKDGKGPRAVVSAARCRRERQAPACGGICTPAESTALPSLPACSYFNDLAQASKGISTIVPPTTEQLQVGGGRAPAASNQRRHA